jgi:hypothetical protein
MNMKHAVTVLSALLITSCGTTELSGGDRADVAAGRKAIVRTSNQSLLGSIVFSEEETVQILMVDGKEIDSAVLKLDEQVALEFGKHVLEVACVDRSGYNEKDFTDFIDLDVKPHHEYLVSCSFDSRFGPNGTYVGAFNVKEKRVE